LASSSVACWRLDASYYRTYVPILQTSRLTDERLRSLYLNKEFGGGNTMRAKVIRELIDEIRALRLEAARVGRQQEPAG
jgi:hypothetical protein